MNKQVPQEQQDRLLDTALHGVAIYNPALWSRQELRDHFVARQSKLERILNDLRRERPGSLPQHRLILGQRGMGKTTLLRRIAIGILDDAELSQQWLPLTFPEEQYNVANLSDLWLNCLDALGDMLEETGRADQADALDDLIATLPKREPQSALDTLITQSKKLQRRFLLLIDNVDLVFDRLHKEDWTLREVLQSQPELALFGASSRAVESSYHYDKAFYDFFKVDELKPLNIDEMHAMLTRLAELDKQPQIAELVKRDPARIKTLHTLTGGNPRTVALLYSVLSNGLEGDVRSDLEGLLDRVTPLYKARFEELPEQSQRVVDAIAVHWYPITAKTLSEILDWKVNLVSAQLTRLEKDGILEKALPQGKKAAFQIAERFFNIWYLMRTSRRVRRKLVWLAKFLKMFFAAEELQKHARDLLVDESKVCERDAEYRFALAHAIELPALRGALENQALYSLVDNLDTRDRLGQLLDFQGEDAPLKSRAEHMHDLAVLREEIHACLPNDLEPKRRKSLIKCYAAAKKLLKRTDSLALPTSGFDDWEAELDTFFQIERHGFGPKFWPIILDAMSRGDILHLGDKEGLEFAIERLELPVLGQAVPYLLEAFSTNIDVSESDIREFLALEPEFTAGWHLLASLLVQSQRYEEAEETYRKAIKMEPKYAPLWWGLGKLLFSSHFLRFKEGLNILQEGVAINPTNAYLRYVLSYFLYITGTSLADAKHAAKKAIKLDPDEIEHQNLYACIQVAQGNWHEARNSILAWCDFTSDAKQHWTSTLRLFQEIVYSDFACDALTLLKDTNLVDRMRPLYEALLALTAETEGNEHYLDKLAPEVRKTASDIVEDLRKPPMRIQGQEFQVIRELASP